MRPLHLSKTLIVVLLGCILYMLGGCKKSNKNNAVKTYDFTFAGNMIERNAISFHFNGPSDQIVVWYFGDDSSANDMNAVHKYNLPGSYVVTLVVKPDSADPIYTITKTITIIPKYYQQISYKLGSTRIWRGVRYGAYGPPGGTLTPYNDDLIDTFAFVIINDDQIEIVNNPKLNIDSGFYEMTSIDTVVKTLEFQLTLGFGPGGAKPYNITYYYGADSVAMKGNDYWKGGWEELYLRTP